MKPVRSEAHLRWIRSLPCAVYALQTVSVREVSCSGRVEAAHIGPHAMGQKASDLDTAPLCSKHHGILHEIGRRQFEHLFGMNFTEILERLKKKPQIRIYPRPGMVGLYWFMAELERETFWLCPVSKIVSIGPNNHAIWAPAGIQDAWRICKDLCCKDRLRMAG